MDSWKTNLRAWIYWLNGRGGEIRTHDLLYPKQARYQATLRPEPMGADAEGINPNPD